MIHSKIIKLCLMVMLAFSAHANTELFNIRYRDKLPVVDVRIGNRLHSLILDTGSSNGLHLYISNILNNPDISIQEIEPLQASDLSGSQFNLRQWTSSNVHLSSVSLNTINIVEFKPWGAGIIEDVSNPEGEVLGAGSFSDKVISINFLENNLIFNDKIPVENSRVLPFELSSSGILLKVIVNNKVLKFAVDTAATESVVFYESLPPNVIYHGCDSVYPGAGRLECNVVSARLSENTKETAEIYAIAINSNSVDGFGFDGILGLDFLKKHNITLDMENKLMYIVD